MTNLVPHQELSMTIDPTLTRAPGISAPRPAMLAGVAGILGLLLGGSPSAACADAGKDIIADAFTGSITEPPGTGETADLKGRTPDGTNLPGGAWNAGIGSLFEDTAWLGGDASMWIQTGDALPTTFTISVDVNFGSGSGLDQPYRGKGLGFLVPFTGGQRYYGVVLQRDGSLLVINGLDRSVVDPATWAKVAPANDLYDTEAWYRLSYEVDTAKAAISHISMVDLVTMKEFCAVPTVTGLKLDFSKANTGVAGMTVNSATGGAVGYFDNFRISATK